ncbi:phosphotransferase enzyme family protein [Actinoplanes regularis]|uniref:phosphotransferase enzyme family protein n=1 Tax=Actinoplanes regularis TaxID=52697 RepID=UPI00255394B5|nr:aminoglycoside phosphotransferase family protein [Actinoplanes regularis]
MSIDGVLGGSLTSESARRVVTNACATLDLSARGAELLRLGENAMFRLGDQPLVMRISRSAERLPIARRELCVARWLHEQGVPVARPFENVSEPLVIDGHPVTVWHLITAGDQRPGVEDLARLLQRVHQLGDGPCDMPKLDPFTQPRARIKSVEGLHDLDRSFLDNWCEKLADAYRSLDFVLPQGFIHGDAHTGNLLGGAGHAFLTDFEMTAVGPREWDLAPIAVSHCRMGLDETGYGRFVELYGFDVTKWAGFDVLRQVRELGMITWLAQNLGEGQVVVDEVALRIASIRNGDTSREWHAF